LSDNQELQLAAAYLSRVAEPANLPLWAFVAEHGYQDAARLVRAGDVPEDVRAATEHRRHADPALDLDAAEQYGIELVTPHDEQWPVAQFRDMVLIAEKYAQWRRNTGGPPPAGYGELLPPLALWVKGGANLHVALAQTPVAIVGARASTAYGDHVATEMSFALAQRGCTIVSGGAFGIDAAAHRGCNAAGGVGVLVSAAGLDRCYPAANRTLYEQTAANGVLVSERPPGSAPHRARFLARNRLIAAFGRATVLVEAATRSGSIHTCGLARELGRPVLAVPGPVTSSLSAGCHAQLRLPRNPAELVTTAADVLAGLDPALTGAAMT